MRPGAALLALALSFCAVAGELAPGALPAEAQRTLVAIRAGGPFPHAQDGRTFANREHRLPIRARGYYREYTVETPGLQGRGPKRIVAGRGGELFYTDDHYRSFRRIRQ